MKPLTDINSFGRILKFYVFDISNQKDQFAAQPISGEFFL